MISPAWRRWARSLCSTGDDLNGKTALPEPFEKEYDVDKPDGTPMLDELDQPGEYLSGTDPNNSEH